MFSEIFIYLIYDWFDKSNNDVNLLLFWVNSNIDIFYVHTSLPFLINSKNPGFLGFFVPMNNIKRKISSVRDLKGEHCFKREQKRSTFRIPGKFSEKFANYIQNMLKIWDRERLLRHPNLSSLLWEATVFVDFSRSLKKQFCSDFLLFCNFSWCGICLFPFNVGNGLLYIAQLGYLIWALC